MQYAITENTSANIVQEIFLLVAYFFTNIDAKTSNKRNTKTTIYPLPR